MSLRPDGDGTDALRRDGALLGQDGHPLVHRAPEEFGIAALHGGRISQEHDEAISNHVVVPDINIAGELVWGEIELHPVVADRVLPQVGLRERGQERDQLGIAVHAVEKAGAVCAPPHPLRPGVADRQMSPGPGRNKSHSGRQM